MDQELTFAIIIVFQENWSTKSFQLIHGILLKKESGCPISVERLGERNNCIDVLFEKN